MQSPHVPLFPLCYSSIESNGAISLICQPNRSEGSHQSPSTEDKSNRTRRGKARTRTCSYRGWQSHTKTSVRTQTRKWCQWLVNPHMQRKLWSHTHTQSPLQSFCNDDRTGREETSSCADAEVGLRELCMWWGDKGFLYSVASTLFFYFLLATLPQKTEYIVDL